MPLTMLLHVFKVCFTGSHNPCSSEQIVDISLCDHNNQRQRKLKQIIIRDKEQLKQMIIRNKEQL